MKTIIIPIIFILLISCAAKAPVSVQSRPELVNSSGTPEFGYLSLVDGLHVTGEPIDVDIAAFRLTVSGLVESPLSLSFDDIKALPSVRKEFDLNCPGFFVDRGYWTGVPLKVLLDKAVLAPGAKTVKFHASDDSYSSSLPLGRALGENILVAYRFNDKELHRAHGFPLRVAAGGETGSIWVKWLSRISVE